MDHIYDWSSKTTTNNLNLEVKQEKVEKIEKPTDSKIKHVEHKKEEAINQALNSFQVNGGSVQKSSNNNKSQNQKSLTLKTQRISSQKKKKSKQLRKKK